MISQLSDSKAQDHWTKELNEDLGMVKNYLDWKKSGHPNFAKWGQENNKVCSILWQMRMKIIFYE